MPVVEKSALVAHTAHQMYELVVDVARYEEFLPWCSRSTLLEKSEDRVCGELEVTNIGIRQTFSTCNKLIPDERVDIALREGPFTRLEGGWQFIALREDACKVVLRLEFEFAGKLMNMAFNAFFTKMADSLVESFCKRADEVYGKDSGHDG